MPSFPFSTLSTLLVLFVYLGLSIVVARARGTYGVHAPAVTGHIEFEKRFRVQMNTLEQIVVLLPALWLCAFWLGDIPAAIGGVVWAIGRLLYARGYYIAAEKREIGFVLSVISTIAMLVATLWNVLKGFL